MYKNRQVNRMLVILLMIMGILSLKLFFMKNKVNGIKNQVVNNIIVDEKLVEVEKYGYSDILELLRENNGFLVKSINMLGNERCNVQVDYCGDIKLLYPSLYSLNESKNFLAVKSISINNDAKITTISIDFKKDK